MEEIFSAIDQWNQEQKKTKSGMYEEFNPNLQSKDLQLSRFTVKVFENGRVNISVSRKT
jgi:hypothetical protein